MLKSHGVVFPLCWKGLAFQMGMEIEIMEGVRHVHSDLQTKFYFSFFTKQAHKQQQQTGDYMGIM